MKEAHIGKVNKVNSATPQRVIGVGAHLHFFGHLARRWINHSVCDAWPVQHQTYGYLPSYRYLCINKKMKLFTKESCMRNVHCAQKEEQEKLY